MIGRSESKKTTRGDTNRRKRKEKKKRIKKNNKKDLDIRENVSEVAFGNKRGGEGWL
jgi:hypothetical protein